MKAALKAVIAMLILVAIPEAALAQAKRTFVSGSGVDSGTCVISAPCRSFAYAVTQTAADGELVVKDGAGYGPVTITQSITIANDGVGTASISVPANGTGVLVNAASTDSVHLRGIEIDGNGVARYGIVVNAGSMDLVNCVSRHSTDAGIIVSGYSQVGIVNSIVTNNGTANPIGGVGVSVGGSGSVVTIDNSVIDHNAYAGLYVVSGKVAVSRSSMSFNEYGLSNENSGATTIVRDSRVASNSIGVHNTAGNTLLSHTMVFNNGIMGLQQTGGQLVSYGDNAINFNGADQAGTITKYSTE